MDDVWCTEFTRDGNGLISGGLDKTVKYWDVSLLGIHLSASIGMVENEGQGGGPKLCGAQSVFSLLITHVCGRNIPGLRTFRMLSLTDCHGFN